MISIIIPTYNRGHLLEKILYSYISQEFVNEIIIVDDNSNDNTREIIKNLILENNTIQITYIKNKSKKGAAGCKYIGAKAARNKLILFGEDDVQIDFNYTEALYGVYKDIKDIGVVSGRIIYKKNRESNEDAKNRFGLGLNNKPIFNKIRFSFNWGAQFTGIQSCFFTHALFLVNRNLFLKIHSDNYKKGNQFREETANQIELLLKGFHNYITDETFCFHLHRAEIMTGGQNSNRLSKLYWSIINTHHFYGFYFDLMKPFTKIKYNKTIAIVLFSINEILELFVRPLKKII